MDFSGRKLRTLKNPVRVIWPLQSTLSVMFACFNARGSIAGVSETPLGTVFMWNQHEKQDRSRRGHIRLSSEISSLCMSRQNEQGTGLDW